MLFSPWSVYQNFLQGVWWVYILGSLETLIAYSRVVLHRKVRYGLQFVLGILS